MLEVLHKLIDAMADLKGFDANTQARMHARLDQEATPAKAAPAPAKADVPAGA